MKKLLAILAFSAAIAMAGCGSVEPAANVQKTTEKTTLSEPSTEATTSEDKMKIIGDMATGKSVFILKLDNKTDRDIVGFSVKAETEDGYPANMLDAKDPFIKNERRTLYYVPAKVSDVVYGDTDEVAAQEYTIKIDFADGESAELHQFPFGDIEEGAVFLEKKVAYIEYTSKKTDKKVSTKDAEKMIADTQSTTEPPSEINPDANNNIDAEPVYTQPTYQQPAHQEPVVTQAATEAPTTPPEPTTVYQEPVTQAPTDAPSNPDSGCIGGGALTW